MDLGADVRTGWRDLVTDVEGRKAWRDPLGCVLWGSGRLGGPGTGQVRGELRFQDSVCPCRHSHSWQPDTWTSAARPGLEALVPVGGLIAEEARG